ncbi:MAG: hypothetical protein LUC33_03780, partial [Prevotellaceae bacterium]|nr:hypothetical protein [Prevotellaceae bacterium]
SHKEKLDRWTSIMRIGYVQVSKWQTLPLLPEKGKPPCPPGTAGGVTELKRDQLFIVRSYIYERTNY